jgi:pentose-5-phosphate-3-epimerase
MGTPIGIKGVSLDPRIPDRIRALTGFRAALGLNFEIFVDGGIRPTTAPILAAAGADGIVPGSLVFKARDPLATIRWIHQGCRGVVPIEESEAPESMRCAQAKLREVMANAVR